MVASAKNKLTGQSGQGTVEYAIVLAGLLCVVVGLGALSNALSDGLFVQHALVSASHHVQAAALGSVGDVFSY